VAGKRLTVAICLRKRKTYFRELLYLNFSKIIRETSMKIKRQAIAALACGLLSTPIVYAQGDPGTYWTNPEGETWKNAEGECWKNPDWTKADATRECDPDLVPKPKPKPAPPPPPPQPAPPPEPAPVVEEVSLAADAHFAVDSAELRPDAIEQIRRLADRAENIKDLGIEVSGHTDSTASEEYNLRLSNRRAASVKEALVEEGIDPGVIMTRGYGETAPVASNDTAEGRAKNRRVDITVTGIKRIMP
jgi:OOP family OmpA-OmpF porin